MSPCSSAGTWYSGSGESAQTKQALSCSCCASRCASMRARTVVDSALWTWSTRAGGHFPEVRSHSSLLRALKARGSSEGASTVSRTRIICNGRYSVFLMLKSLRPWRIVFRACSMLALSIQPLSLPLSQSPSRFPLNAFTASRTRRGTFFTILEAAGPKASAFAVLNHRFTAWRTCDATVPFPARKDASSTMDVVTWSPLRKRPRAILSGEHAMEPFRTDGWLMASDSSPAFFSANRNFLSVIVSFSIICLSFSHACSAPGPKTTRYSRSEKVDIS
mmetsp:Transcript_121676/g.344813  ORF Transcript_121676/g.344813 Transcript_121676/m.344813 type:complete len:276 (+) Transcript_121676:209-1036(+)